MNMPRSCFLSGDLTPEKFDCLLLRLDPDRERAGARYEEIRRKLLRFFQWRSCRDAETLVDETFDRVAEKLASENEEVRNIAAFAWGVARKVRQEALRNDAKTLSLPDLFYRDGPLADKWASANPECGAAADRQRIQRIQCLRKCIQSLSDRDRKLFVTYHLPGGRRAEGRRRLAQEAGITPGALRIRATRLRFKLSERITRHLAAIMEKSCHEMRLRADGVTHCRKVS